MSDSYNEVVPNKKRVPAVLPLSVETIEEENARLKRELARSHRRIAQLEADRKILQTAASFLVKGIIS